ncbi:formin-like protein 5 [Wolffia australiana]
MKRGTSCFRGTPILLVISCFASIIFGGSASRTTRDWRRVMIHCSSCSPEISDGFYLGDATAENYKKQGTLRHHSTENDKFMDKFQVSGEDLSSRNRWIENLQLLIWPSAQRRKLNDEQSETVAKAPSSLDIISVDSPAPSPDLQSTSIQFDDPLADHPEQIDSFQQDDETLKSPQNIAMILSPKKHGRERKKAVIASVVLIAAGSIALSAILCYCINACKPKRGGSRRDHRPLLALSLGKFSAGSSLKSQELNEFSESRKRREDDNLFKDFEVPTTPKPSTENLSAGPATEVSLAKTPPPPPPPPRPRPPLPPPIAPKNRPGPLPIPKGETSVKPDVQGSSIDCPKTKLKPFFWDKVVAKPDQTMVWHQISSGSFQFNEEMIETMFGYSASRPKSGEEKKSPSSDPAPQLVQILDQKKSQNLAILLRALNVTIEEIREALMEGNELPSELLQTLIKMAPTADEELKLRVYDGEVSCLGPAERFLKVLVDIPFAFTRMEAMLIMSSFEDELSSIRQDLQTIEAACEELKSSRLFKKLLEAVVKIGNRMNDGTFRGGARAFKLDTLLKLADVKSADGASTLLHFLALQIAHSEALRAHRTAHPLAPPPPPDTCRSLGLPPLAALPADLRHVRLAAPLDPAALSASVLSLARAAARAREILLDGSGSESGSGFDRKLEGFAASAEAAAAAVAAEERRVNERVNATCEFFHGESGDGLRLFAVVAEFLAQLERACREVSAPPVDPKRPPGSDKI